MRNGSRNVTRHPQPHSWQLQLGETETLTDRLIRIPTGFGKTIGIAASWYFHAVASGRPEWPRRLVWCLPSRVLVEQTAAVLRVTQVATAFQHQPER